MGSALLEHLPPHQPGLRLASAADRLHQLAPLHALRARLPHQLLLDLVKDKVRDRAWVRVRARARARTRAMVRVRVRVRVR